MEQPRSEFSFKVQNIEQAKVEVESWLKANHFKTSELDTEPVFLRKKFPGHHFYFDYATELNTLYLYCWLRQDGTDFPIDSPDFEKPTRSLRKSLQNLFDVLENL